MKYRYRTDEEMKDSGVEWIGKIPKDWTISRIDKEFEVRNEKVSDKEYPPLSVTKNGILPQLENVAKSDNSDNRKKVCIGDFIINSRADRKGSCGVSSYNGSVSLICNVLTSKNLNSQYVHSLFRNYYFSEEFYRWGSGIVDDLWSTNIEKMKKINIPIPLKNEDVKIANFLDEKTSQFDSIISKKEELIKKLEEAKKSLISEVVTGKVKVVKTDDGYELIKRNSDEMKYSGVEWLGEIPKDWEVTKVKYNCDINKLTLSENTEDNYEIKYIDIGSVTSNGEVTNIQKFMFKDAPSRARRIVKDKDILISTVRTYLKAITSIEKSEDNLICSTGFAVLTPNEKVNYKFLSYFVRCNLFIDEIVSRSTGVSYPAITSSEISNLEIILPAEIEQVIIGEFIQLKIYSINNIINKIELEIQKLKEAKQSLISEAVTGKIEILD